MLEEIMECFPDEEFLIADDYNHCIIGIEETTMRVVYSTGCILRTLQEEAGMDEEEALEFYCFNILGSYMGDKTPIFVQDEF